MINTNPFFDFSQEELTAKQQNQLAEENWLQYVFILHVVHVGGTRCVTWSIDRIIQIHGCITWGVEFIRAIFFIIFLYG